MDIEEERDKQYLGQGLKKGGETCHDADQSISHLRCKDILSGSDERVCAAGEKQYITPCCHQLTQYFTHIWLKKKKSASFPLSSSVCITTPLVSLLVSLFRDPPGCCINTFLFPYHLPHSPPPLFLSSFQQIKVLSLFEETHFLLREEHEVSKRVMERGEG